MTSNLEAKIQERDAVKRHADIQGHGTVAFSGYSADGFSCDLRCADQLLDLRAGGFGRRAHRLPGCEGVAVLVINAPDSR